MDGSWNTDVQWLLSILLVRFAVLQHTCFSSLGGWGGAACFIAVNELNPAGQQSTCMQSSPTMLYFMSVLSRHLNIGLALALLWLGGEHLFSWWFFRGFFAIGWFGWLVWLLNCLRGSSQGCIRTSELFSGVLLLQATGEDIAGKGSVS